MLIHQIAISFAAHAKLLAKHAIRRLGALHVFDDVGFREAHLRQ